MNQEAFEAGKKAYLNKDYATAVAHLKSAKPEGEAAGALDHMLGNAYMRMKMYPEAARAYQSALADTTYAKRGAVLSNYGRALAGSGQTQEAIAALEEAIADSAYQSHYKAQMLLGKIFEKQGNVREAGAQYRNAAIDENNPDPAVALLALGRCFMNLGRPIDAVEAYRTALDFSTEAASQAQIYAELGSAFVAGNRMQEALDAFQKATADTTFTLNPNQHAAMAEAQKAVATLAAKRGGETDSLLAAAGYGPVDPLDPLGKSGEFIPSPEDTGFFEVKEEDIVEKDPGEHKGKKDKKKQKKNAKKAKKAQGKKKKKRHPVRIVLITLLVVLIMLFAGSAFAYYKGFGIPSQESVVTDIFSAKTNNQDIHPYLASNLSDTQQRLIESILPEDATITIDGVDRTTNTSIVSCVAHLEEGGTQPFKVTLVRDGLGWKISSVDLIFDSYLKR